MNWKFNFHICLYSKLAIYFGAFGHYYNIIICLIFSNIIYKNQQNIFIIIFPVLQRPLHKLLCSELFSIFYNQYSTETSLQHISLHNRCLSKWSSEKWTPLLSFLQCRQKRAGLFSLCLICQIFCVFSFFSLRCN